MSHRKKGVPQGLVDLVNDPRLHINGARPPMPMLDLQGEPEPHASEVSLSPEMAEADGSLARWRMTRDHVFVEKASRRYNGLLHLPDKVAKEQNVALVRDVGPNVKDPRIRVGRLVLLGKYGGTEVHLEEGEFLVLEESEILAVLQTAPPPVVETDAQS